MNAGLTHSHTHTHNKTYNLVAVDIGLVVLRTVFKTMLPLVRSWQGDESAWKWDERMYLNRSIDRLEHFHRPVNFSTPNPRMGRRRPTWGGSVGVDQSL